MARTRANRRETWVVEQINSEQNVTIPRALTTMILEATIIERVETFARHPVFAGSAQLMEGVLEDLQCKVEAGQITDATYQRLRDLILGSPHFRMN